MADDFLNKFAYGIEQDDWSKGFGCVIGHFVRFQNDDQY